jgi:hypothetical protein
MVCKESQTHASATSTSDKSHAQFKQAAICSFVRLRFEFYRLYHLLHLQLVSFSKSRAYHRENHLKILYCFQGIWLISQHYGHLTFFQANGFVGDNNFCFTIKEINEGIK